MKRQNIILDQMSLVWRALKSNFPTFIAPGNLNKKMESNFTEPKNNIAKLVLDVKILKNLCAAH